MSAFQPDQQVYAQDRKKWWKKGESFAQQWDIATDNLKKSCGKMSRQLNGK